MQVLIIAAHPDDEVLGCGGTIIKHVESGDEVTILIMTNGSTVRYGEEMKETLKNNAEKCGKILGAKNLIFKNLPEQELDGIPLLHIVKEIEAIIDAVQPTIIYTHHKGDINQDHRAIFEATMIAARPISPCVKEIYSYEIPSATEWCPPTEERIFIPNVFIDISSTIKNKILAFKSYDSQIKKWPNSRSLKGIEVLAQFRGMQSGTDSAEAFSLIRQVKK